MDLAKRLTQFHVVFVRFSNFLTELIGFQDNAKALQKIGARNISFVDSLFFGSYEANSNLLKNELSSLYERGGRRPLIIIGNPQSGPYSLYAVLQNSFLVKQGIISKIVLVTPAFGSPLADELLGYRKTRAGYSPAFEFNFVFCSRSH